MEYIPGLIVGIPLFILGIFFCAGKLLFLIAGFHTSEQQEGYNAKKVGRIVGGFLMLMSVILAFGISKDTTTVLISSGLIVFLSVVLVVLVNTLKYFKK